MSKTYKHVMWIRVNCDVKNILAHYVNTCNIIARHSVGGEGYLPKWCVWACLNININVYTERCKLFVGIICTHCIHCSLCGVIKYMVTNPAERPAGRSSFQKNGCCAVNHSPSLRPAAHFEQNGRSAGRSPCTFILHLFLSLYWWRWCVSGNLYEYSCWLLWCQISSTITMSAIWASNTSIHNSHVQQLLLLGRSTPHSKTNW